MRNDKPFIKNFYLVFDFEGGDDFIPNGLNYDTTDILFEHHGFINNDVVDYYFKHYTQIPVLKEMLNIHHDMIDKISLSKYEEYFEENPENTFIYPIEPFANLDHVLGNEYSYNKKPFTEYMSEKSLELIRDEKSKFFLLVNFCNEGTLRHYTFKNLYEILDEAGIPPKKFIFVSAAADVVSLHDTYAYLAGIPYDGRFKCMYHTWSLGMKVWEAKHILEETPDNRQINIDQKHSTLPIYEDLDKNKIRGNKFIYLNRRMRDHRVLLLSLLGPEFIKENLVSYDWEWCNDATEIDFFTRRVIDKYWEHGLENMKYLEENLPKSWVDYEDVTSTIGFGCENKEPYLDSYINITSETNFFDAGVYFSEKTWKPILNLQPFISINYHNSLDYLKELGLKTFSPFIDESYDKIANPAERIATIYEEIMRLNALPIEEIHNWYYSIMDILKYNREHLLTFTGDKLIELQADYIYDMERYANSVTKIKKII